MISQVIAMRRAGLPNAEIAAKLNVSLGSLAALIRQLVREGAISSRRGLLWSHPDSWVEGHERRRKDVAGKVQRLYKQGKSHEQIATRLNLTTGQVHRILTGLFATGLAKRAPHQLTKAQVQGIHKRYLGGGAINDLAAEIGFSGAAVREHMHKLGLPLERGPSARRNDRGACDALARAGSASSEITNLHASRRRL